MDDGKTRKVKAVQRKKTAITEQATREIDRVLIISAAIFMDRVFHTGEEQ